MRGPCLYTAPEARDPSAQGSKMGQALFESFDPRAATGIEIVEVDEENIESKTFEVSQTEKGWFIKRPGKTDYPANADNQVKNVSSILFDLRIIDQAAEGPASMLLLAYWIPPKQIQVMLELVK